MIEERKSPLQLLALAECVGLDVSPPRSFVVQRRRGSKTASFVVGKHSERCFAMFALGETQFALGETQFALGENQFALGGLCVLAQNSRIECVFI